MYQIGIIGAGKVGVSLGKYFCEQGFSVQGFCSKSIASARTAAAFTGTKVYETYKDMVKDCNILFLTVPDGVIKNVWNEIKMLPIAGKNICHCSGSISSEIFSDIDKCQAFGYSIHPLYAISDKMNSYQELPKVLFTIEGAKEHLEDMKGLFTKMGNPVQEISSKDKVKYHAAAAMVSNEMIALYASAMDLLVQCGFEKERAREVLFPLAKGNLEAVGEKGIVNSLTGPIERNDIETVKKHMAAMKDSQMLYGIYAALGKRLVLVAMEKHPERDYSEMQQLFE